MSALQLGTPPIPGSSVPGDPAVAIQYAHRLERRFYKDQERIFAADRKLAIAQQLLEEFQRVEARVKIAEALAAIQAARGVLL